MKRMPSFLSECTERFPRVSRSYHASPCGWKYRAPLYKRVLFFMMRNGWGVIVPVLLAALFMSLSGCVDIDTEERTAATVRDREAEARALRP